MRIAAGEPPREPQSALRIYMCAKAVCAFYANAHIYLSIYLYICACACFIIDARPERQTFTHFKKQR